MTTYTVKEHILNALGLFFDRLTSIFIRISNTVDNCASTSTSFPLSANQGRALQEQIDTLNTNMQPQFLDHLETEHMMQLFSCLKYPAIKIALVSGTIKRGVISTEVPLITIGAIATNTVYAPINSHGGVDGEVYINGNTSTIAANISSNNGDGKFLLVIPIA